MFIVYIYAGLIIHVHVQMCVYCVYSQQGCVRAQPASVCRLYLAQASTKFLTIEAFVLKRSSRVIPKNVKRVRYCDNQRQSNNPPRSPLHLSLFTLYPPHTSHLTPSLSHLILLPSPPLLPLSPHQVCGALLQEWRPRHIPSNTHPPPHLQGRASPAPVREGGRDTD